jgi:hypothetical protein
MTWLMAALLILHGAVHLAVWLSPAPTDAEQSAPFAPDHSAVLTRTHVAPTTAHVLATRLAVAAAVAYGVSGLAVAFGSEWAAGIAVAAAILGLTLKAVFFNPWLSLGVLLDTAVLSAALLSWPISLT